MHNNIFRSLILTVLLISVIFIFYLNFITNRVIVYDCSLAEISPDYPKEVKEECKKFLIEEYKKENKKIYI